MNRPNVTVKLGGNRRLRYRAVYGLGKLPPFHNRGLEAALREVPGVENVRPNLHFQTLFITFIPKSSLQKKGMFNNLNSVFGRFGYTLEEIGEVDDDF